MSHLTSFRRPHINGALQPRATAAIVPRPTIFKKMGRFSRLTRPFNGLGLPALSLPCGFSTQGLPLALAIVGRPFDEATVLRAGQAYEQAAGWVSRRPVIG